MREVTQMRVRCTVWMLQLLSAAAFVASAAAVLVPTPLPCTTSEGPATLSPDMPECWLRGAIRGGETQTWEFQIPPYAAAVPFPVVMELRAIRGDVTFTVQQQRGQPFAPSHQYLSVPTLDTVVIPRATVQQSPGTYTLAIIGVADRSTFKLSIMTPTVDMTVKGSALNPSGGSAGDDEAGALRDMYTRCCAIEDNEMGSSCEVLKGATAPNGLWQNDICQQPPNQCDQDGHLTRLVLPGTSTGNFVCTGGIAAVEFSRFSRLQTLDLSNNWITGGLPAVSRALAPLTALRHLYLSVNLLEGTLDCPSLLALPQLEVLWLNWNSMAGSLPACVSQLSGLRELVLSSNGLNGPLPDLRALTRLEMMDLADNGDSKLVGLRGSIPSGLSSPLTFLDLCNNNLTGSMPVLPPSLQSLLLGGNQLDAGLTPSITAMTSLRSLWGSNNKMTGPLPAGLQSLKGLVHLELGFNQFSGPVFVPNAQDWVLSTLDLTKNQLTGQLPPSLGAAPNLQRLLLRGNRLSGGLSALASQLQLQPSNSLLQLDLANNLLTGSVPGGELGALALFTSPPSSSLMDLSGNALSGPFPLGLLTALQGLTQDSSLRALHLVLGPQATTPSQFLCPRAGTSLVLSPALLQAEYLYDLKCLHPQLGLVYISAALAYVAPGDGTTPAPTQQQPQTTAPDPSQLPSSSTPPASSAPSSSSSSAVVGIAVACAVGGVLLASASAVGIFVYKKRRAGAAAAAAPGPGPGSIFYNNPISTPDVPSAGNLALPSLRLDVGGRSLAAGGWVHQTKKGIKMAMSGVVSGGGRLKGRQHQQQGAASTSSGGSGGGAQWTANNVYCSEDSRQDLDPRGSKAA